MGSFETVGKPQHINKASCGVMNDTARTIGNLVTELLERVDKDLGERERETEREREGGGGKSRYKIALAAVATSGHLCPPVHRLPWMCKLHWLYEACG